MILTYAKKSMSFNHEVKGTLARLLATENLIVEHKRVKTASFDVNNRVLILPIWDKASSVVYDMLVGHEVGHALYTPDQWDFIGEIPKDYVNVVEDARIEKLMKRKFPGLSKSFFNGYNELNEQDFFSIQDEDLKTFSLIDRINLHFKVGAYAQIPFKDSEQFLVDMVSDAETFDDVLETCRKILEYEKNEEEDQAPLPTLETPQGGSGESQDERSDSISNQVESGGSEDSDELDESNESESTTDSMETGKLGGGPKEKVSKTQRAFDQESEKLSYDNVQYETRYVEVPEIILDKVIVDNKDLHDHISSCFHEFNSNRDPKYWDNAFEKSDKDYLQYKSQSQKEVNYLVKEFECKKSADAYARMATSKTGVLDTQKLHTYKFSEDIFKKVSVIPDGKNHGLIFILDWSGSMQDYILDTVKQLLNLVWFCKKVQIPFEVYAFTYDWNPRLINPELGSIPEKYVKKANAMILHKFFHLLNFFSSRCSSKEFETQCLNIWRIAYRLDKDFYSSYPIPSGLDLSGTPLNESIMTLHKIIPQFKSSNKLQKVNVVILTDGEANGIAYHVQRNPYGKDDVLGSNHVSPMCSLRDRKTGHVYRSFEYDGKSSITNILLENIKHNFPEVNLIGFRILSGYEFNSICRTIQDPSQLNEIQNKWKKEKSCEIKNIGYDSLYAIKSNNLSQDSEFNVSEDATNVQIGKAFRTMLKKKTTNKKILSSFASLVS